MPAIGCHETTSTRVAAFVDTNVLLYAVSTVADEADKRRTARAILDRDDLVLSVQVLQEFYVQATRATKPDRLAHEPAVGARRVMAALSRDGDDSPADAACAGERAALAHLLLGRGDRRSRPGRRLSDIALGGLAAGHELFRSDGGESIQGGRYAPDTLKGVDLQS